jgi:hypothetical protein
MARLHAVSSILFALSAASLGACSGFDINNMNLGPSHVPTGAAGSAGPDTPPGFARFPDIPMPANNSIDLDRTLVLGGDREWTGRLAISTSTGVNEMYDFYRREMPNYGWTELTSVRGSASFLAYQLDSRVATIHVTSRGLGGASVDFIVAPRQQISTRAPASIAPAAGPASSIPPGSAAVPRANIEQAPAPPRRR